MTVRDDFAIEVKRTLAARVGNICSNPDCRALTSGPQEDSDRTLNLGVTAHIAAASPGGPRDSPSMSRDDRSRPGNGIWLCQNCAKLIDNDVIQFPKDVLRAWKMLAEHHARSIVGRASPPQIETEGQRKLRALAPWKGETITLSHMTSGNAVYMIGPVYGSSWVEALECTEFYVTVGKTGADGWTRSIPLEGASIAFDNAHGRLEFEERQG
jgi:hypothetical protein